MSDITLRPATNADYDLPYNLHKVTLQDATAVGTLTVQRTATEIFLANIGILSAYQGQGIGTRLIQSLLAEATESGLERVS
jgi:N-acetylglutamate synthase-like GNAT family acetyltransferase